MQRGLPELTSRYRIVDEIAQGGMGAVFVALQTDPSGRVSPVAIKRLHAHLIDDETVVGAFADEARIASKLHHPNVVRVHDVVPIDGQLVIVMDWVEGVALNTILKKREPIPIPIVRRILIDMLEGLHAAHDLKDENGAALSVVHRDISPQNLLVGADGLTRVTDFGIAIAKGRLAPTTIRGGVKGKIPYLSPEQVNRTPVDHRSDLFAAGVVAWELLVGKRLFNAGSEGEIMAMILREPIVPPSSVRVDVPLDLDETVLRALERKADRRFPTAAAFAKAIASGGPVAPHEDVGRLIIAAAGTAIAARRQKLTLARERPAPPRSLQEEMTATILVPSAPVSARRSAPPPSIERVVIAPALLPPPVAIPPPPASLPLSISLASAPIPAPSTSIPLPSTSISIPPPSTSSPLPSSSPPPASPSLPPTATTDMTMKRAPRSTTATLVAAIVGLCLAIGLVVKYSGADPPKEAFPAAPSLPTPEHRPAEATSAPTTPSAILSTIELPTTAPPPQIKPHRPAGGGGGHRSRPDAGRGQPFMPDDL